MAILTLLFFVTALLYAMVGFGGGSTYNALLVLHGVDYRLLPSIALVCNIIVVSGGVYIFSRAGHLKLVNVLPFVVLSVPMAWLGGRLPVGEQTFVGLLGLALAVAGAQLLLGRRASSRPARMPRVRWHWLVGVPLGAVLGLLAGIVGIGGGIFLAPVLHYLRWFSVKAVAAAASFFILINSIAGLAGQLSKLEDFGTLSQLRPYVVLYPAVLLGGQIGSRLGAHRIPAAGVKRLTGLLILYVSGRLLWRWYMLGRAS